ncbi:ComF family protein [Lysinibacillus endophyticus]|uniref:ComF family protein n=1 Tax=Ureibacillus endophyticus TaxID=1978490 RepID=UPI003136699B
MKRNEFTHCLLCNAPLNEPITWKALLTNAFTRTICTECEQKFEPYNNQNDQNIVSLYQYNEAMKDFLHRYKFMHDVLLAKVFRDKIHQKLARKTEIIIPIPMHPMKLKERTFSPIDELLKEAKIPFKHYLEKTTTETQGSKTRKERITTPQLFKLKENQHEIIDQHLLLVDDIYTTGTTIQHARKLLLGAGAKSVLAFTLIRG